MTAKQETIVKCPFYMGSRRDTIECESFIGHTVMLTRFCSVSEMMRHVRQFCVREDGGECPLAVNLYDKYARLEQQEHAAKH